MSFFIGTITPFPFSLVPQGWLRCDGQLLDISNYPVLFSLIGTTYGGDGKANFALPQLNAQTATPPQPARAPIGQSVNGPMTPRAVGQSLGAATVTLMPGQMPSHNHAMRVFNLQDTQTVPISVGTLGNVGNATFMPSAQPGLTTLCPAAVAVQGQGNPHTNMQPYLELAFCICVVGDVPQFN